MTTTVVPQIGGLSQVGLATETTSGTFKAPTSLLPFSEATIDPNPGLFYPPAIFGYRDTNTWPLYGQQKLTGALGAALYPTNGSPIFSAAFGTDNQAGAGVTGTTPSQSGTINASIIGATQVTMQAAPGSSYVTGAFIQVDVNNATTPTTAECRKITGVTGDVVAFDVALVFAHAAAAPISTVVAPFVHTLIPTATLPTLSVSKRVGNTQAEQWAGCAVGKFALKGQATNTAIDFTADIEAKTVTINDAPATIAVIDEPPLEWVGLTMTYNSLVLDQANNLSFTLDNKLMVDYTFNQLHTPQFLTPAGLIVNGSFEVIYDSLDDTNWGFFSQIVANQISTGLTLDFVGANSQEFKIIMDKVNLSTYKDNIKDGDTIKTSIGFEAALDLSDTPPRTVKALISDAQYLPF